MTPFFHIGFPKSGSTTLQRHIFPFLDNVIYLGLNANQNDQNLFNLLSRFYSGVLKTDGLHFDFSERMKDRNEILNLYPERPVLFSHEACISTIYSYPDVITKAERLYKVFEGKLKIILIVREQKAILSSQYRDHPFEPKDIHEGKPVSFEQWYRQMDKLRYFRFTDLLYYDRLIKVYDDLFGRKNVLVLPLELMSSAPNIYAERMGGFLDVDPDAIRSKLGKKPENTGHSVGVNRLRRWRRKIPVPIRFSKFLPAPIYNGLKNAIINSATDKVAMNDALKEEIDLRYGDSNKVLEERTGVPLNALGYSLNLRQDHAK